MAHIVRNLRRRTTISLSPQVMFFDYATNHTKAEVLAAGFFNESRGNLTPRSIIDAIIDADGAPEFVRIRIVTVPDTGDITVALAPAPAV